MTYFRRTILLIAALLLIAGSASAALVQFYLPDQTGTNLLRTSVKFTSLTNPQLASPYFYAANEFTVANTNLPLEIPMHGGRWRVTAGSRSWVIAFPETNGVINAADWADTNLNVFTYTTPLPWSVTAGSNVVVYTENSSFVVNATATDGGGLTAADVIAIAQTNKTAEVTISPMGIINGLSAITNNGANFGPDTPGTTTCGWQEAIYSLPRTNHFGPITGGGMIRAAWGIYDVTNTVVIPNQFPFNLTVVGDGKIGSMWKYWGTSNVVQSSQMDPEGHYNSLNLRLQDVMFAYVKDTNKAVMLSLDYVNEAIFDNVAFVSWQVLTEPGMGSSLTYFDHYPTNAVGIIPIRSRESWNMMKFYGCAFYGLATGPILGDYSGMSGADHVRFRDCFFGSIGRYYPLAGGTGRTNAYPTIPGNINTNLYASGACIVAMGNSDMFVDNCQFTENKVVIINNGTVEITNPVLDANDWDFVDAGLNGDCYVYQRNDRFGFRTATFDLDAGTIVTNGSPNRVYIDTILQGVRKWQRGSVNKFSLDHNTGNGVFSGSVMATGSVTTAGSLIATGIVSSVGQTLDLRPANTRATIFVTDNTEGAFPAVFELRSGTDSSGSDALEVWSGFAGFDTNKALTISTGGLEINNGGILVQGPLNAGSVIPDGAGIKHKRVTTGSISAGSDALVTLTWSTAFPDANYSVSPSVVDSTASASSLAIVHVESISASQVKVRVKNNSGGSLTGTLHVIGFHD